MTEYVQPEIGEESQEVHTGPQDPHALSHYVLETHVNELQMEMARVSAMLEKDTTNISDIRRMCEATLEMTQSMYEVFESMKPLMANFEKKMASPLAKMVLKRNG